MQAGRLGQAEEQEQGFGVDCKVSVQYSAGQCSAVSALTFCKQARSDRPGGARQDLRIVCE
eukprot:1180072-Prorocentrum_minimum.AAC.1